MKVVLVCNDDHANVAYELQECLRRVDVSVKAFTRRPHPFNYEKQAEVIRGNNLRDYAETADIVVFVHSEYLNIGVSLQGKKVYVYHTGTTYRQNSKIVNSIFNPIVTATFCGGDVLGMGAKNKIWVIGAINTNKIQPKFDRIYTDALVVGHFPRGKTKGTEKIIPLIEELSKNYDFEFRYGYDSVSWPDQIKRMGDCDIFIEAVVEHQNGIPLTLFGISAIEAACLGKIVIARFPMKPQYEKIFGKCAIQHVNNIEELKIKLEWLFGLPEESILGLKKESRNWVESCHSYEAVGERFKKIFEQ